MKKDFDYFLKNGSVSKISSNKDRAKSLIKEARFKKEFLELSLKSLPKEKMNYNFVVDYSYDIILELIRAKMIFDGFNSKNSHEAEVFYLAVLDFPEKDISFLNELRFYRNGTKYYGTLINKEYSEKVLEFLEKIYPKLLGILDNDKLL